MENTTLNFGGGKRQRGGDWAGFFNSQDELNLWTQLNTNELFVGLRATLPYGPVTWRGASAGWVADTLAYSPSTALGPNLYDGVEAQVNKYLDDDGVVKSLGGYAVSNPIPVSPGDKFILALGLQGLNKYGGYFSGSTWLSKIGGSEMANGFFTVPAGCDNIVITVAMAGSGWPDYAPAFVRKVTSSVSTKKYTSISSIGDSICRGFKSTKPFTSVVAERLGIAAGNIDNNGIDSSTIANSANTPISGRMSQLTPADIVLFEGGGNDFSLITATLGTAADTTDATFYGALYVCAEYLRKNFPLSTVVWVSVPRWEKWDTPNSKSLTMDAYMDAFKSVALRYGFAYADGYNKMSIAAFPAGRVIASDYAHLNDIGHQQLADIIMRAIGR